MSADGFEAMQRELDTPLHRDLAACITDTAMGPYIKHPWYFGPPQMAWTANQVYEQKKRLAHEYLAEGNIRGLLFAIHERPYRPAALLQYADLLDDEEWWAAVADVWTDTEAPSDQWQTWDLILHADRPGREAMMDDADREVWDRFTAEPVTVYRGVSTEGDGELHTDGFAWTTHLPRAEWFARRWAHSDSTAWVIHGEVMRADVIAYFVSRSEHEVLVHPKHVHVTQVVALR